VSPKLGEGLWELPLLIGAIETTRVILWVTRFQALLVAVRVLREPYETAGPKRGDLRSRER
jgi:hypothetical protein